MTTITRETPLLEVAALVSQALMDAGINAVLSGGAAVSIYTDNRYQSVDLDFVTAARNAELAVALAPIGFEHSGRPTLSVFRHPDCAWYLEFPPGPVALGGRDVRPEDCALLQTDHGDLRIVSPTQIVMDRLAAAIHWKDRQSLIQAAMVAADQELDWQDLEAWLRDEGEPDFLKVFRDTIAGVDN